MALPFVRPMPVRYGDSSSVDAYGRLRVGNPQTMLDSKLAFDNQPLVWDDQEVSGSGTTSVYDNDKASVLLGVAGATAGRRVRQTFMRFNHQGGKSQLIILMGTLVYSGGGPGIRSAAGAFDDNNGIFVQQNGNNTELVLRSDYTGSVVDTVVPRVLWNIDPFEGGSPSPSGLVVDSTTFQAMIIDYSGLGVGRVRVGLIIEGIMRYLHEFTEVNMLDATFSSTPNLPLRYEIENDGTGVTSTMRHVGSTIISEGGEDEIGISRGTSTKDTPLTAAVKGVLYALIGIRLKSSALACAIDIAAFSMIAETNDDFEALLICNPNITGDFVYGDEVNSCIQSAKGSTGNVVSGGIVLECGYGKANIPLTIPSRSSMRLGSKIDGTADRIVLCVRSLSQNAKIQGSLTWRELN